MSWPRMPSSSGCSRASASSSSTTSAAPPSRRSASIRPSVVARRSDSRRDCSARMNPSPSRPSRAWPRHSASAAPSSRRASAASPARSACRPSPPRRSNCATSSEPPGMSRTYPADRRAQGRRGRLERRPQLADVAVDDGRRGGRRLVAPDGVDQSFGRDHLARVEQQEREQGPLLRSAEGLGAPSPSPTSRWPSNRNSARGRSGAAQRSPASRQRGGGGAHPRAPDALHPRAMQQRGRRPTPGAPGVRRIVRRLRQFFVAASCVAAQPPGHDRRAPPAGDAESRRPERIGPRFREEEGRGSRWIASIACALTIGAAAGARGSVGRPGGGHLSRRRRAGSPSR